MTTVQVMLKERSYTIRVRPDSLAELGELLAAEFETDRVVVITTPRVAGLHYEPSALDRMLEDAPGAYKCIDEVMRAQRPLTRIVRQVRPVLSYKAG